MYAIFKWRPRQPQQVRFQTSNERGHVLKEHPNSKREILYTLKRSGLHNIVLKDVYNIICI